MDLFGAVFYFKRFLDFKKVSNVYQATCIEQATLILNHHWQGTFTRCSSRSVLMRVLLQPRERYGFRTLLLVVNVFYTSSFLILIKQHLIILVVILILHYFFHATLYYHNKYFKLTLLFTLSLIKANVPTKLHSVT